MKDGLKILELMSEVDRVESTVDGVLGLIMKIFDVSCRLC